MVKTSFSFCPCARHPEYGALFVVVGKDHLYPVRHVEMAAGTRVACEMRPDGFQF